MNRGHIPRILRKKQKKGNGSSRLREAAFASVIIWDKDFIKPSEEQLPEGETIVSSSFSSSEALQDFVAEIEEAPRWSGQGFGKP